MNKTEHIKDRAIRALIAIGVMVVGYLFFDVIGMWVGVALIAVAFTFGMLLTPDEVNKYYEAGAITHGSGLQKKEGLAQQREEDARRKGRMKM